MLRSRFPASFLLVPVLLQRLRSMVRGIAGRNNEHYVCMLSTMILHLSAAKSLKVLSTALQHLRTMVHALGRRHQQHMSVDYAQCFSHSSAAQSAQVLCLALQRLRSMVHEIVLNFHELCALYAITDVALVTSLRDGMNLVSYEYVACQSDNAGEACH